MLIKLEDVTYIYQQQKVKALDDISLSIGNNEFVGLVGHTGSGKSTLVQLFNGLMKPTRGRVIVDGTDITNDKINLNNIRQKVGLVFQYPEHQLFEETIFDDIAFGPRNLDLDSDTVKDRVKIAMRLVDLDFEEFKDRSPFNLSGGQKRRVAIAGVLAMRPQVLILDEPTAGLDPRGRDRLMDLLKHLYHTYEMTIILISHRMEEIAQLSDRVIVLDQGRVEFDGTPREVFSNEERLKELGLGIPQVSQILSRLKDRGLQVRTDIFELQEAREEILAELRRRQTC